MSTRSIIAMKVDGGYRGIYCHFDGYPSGVGKTLLDHYTDAKKVEALIALGDISSLGGRVGPIGKHSFENREDGTTVAYGRDRGETDCETTIAPTTRKLKAIFSDTDYLYVFEDGKWTVDGEEFDGTE